MVTLQWGMTDDGYFITPIVYFCLQLDAVVLVQLLCRPTADTYSCFFVCVQGALD